MNFATSSLFLFYDKILFNVVLILLGQHCTGKPFVQYCPRVSRQHCTGKNSVQCCLNTLGTTLHRKKIVFNLVLILLGQHCTNKNIVQCCLNTFGTTLHRKKIAFNLVLILLGQ